ncbi:AraC family transcriptional regulator [Chitiniphilus shinanonensis]|uniref:AraC family transcriptional regulator n=1 Tax=Chitiniphilus shinanonensis TaxID=553088 RepID=UPI003052E7B4
MLRQQNPPRAPGHSWYDAHFDLPALEFDWHYHGDFELTLTLDQGGQRYLGDRIDDYTSPDLVLIPPGVPHTWQSSRGDTHEVHVLLLPAGWAQRLVEAGVLESLALVALLGRAAGGLQFSPATALACLPLCRALRDAGALARLGLLFAIVAELAADDRATPLGLSGGPPQPLDAQLRQMLEYMHAHYTEALTQETVAAHCGLSVASLRRRFDAGLGEPFGRYLQRLRIGRACHLLWSSRLPVEHVAQASGFASPGNFHRQFRAQKGMTPAQFRRLRQATVAAR